MTTSLDDRIRDAFAHRAEQTRVTRDPASGVDGTSTEMVTALDGRPPRPWRSVTVGATAAAVALVVVGAVVLVARSGDSNDPSPTVPADATPVLPTRPAPLSIDLDAVAAALPQAPAVARSYVVLDQSAMEDEDWSIADASITPMLDMSGGSRTDAYRYQAQATGPGGEQFHVNIESPTWWQVPQPGNVASTMVGGEPAWLGGDPESLPQLQWPRGDMLVTVSAPSSRTTSDDLVRAAESLRFSEVDRLPPLADPADVDATLPEVGTDEAVLGGRLGGTAWAAEVDPSTLRTMRVTTVGGGSAISSDRLSQPTDDPATMVELSISGVPGRGAIAYGWAPPAAAQVRVLVDEQSVAELPLYRRPGEAFYAVPIPNGLAVTGLHFVGESGDEVARTDLPGIPPDLDGTFVIGAGQ